VEVVQKTWKPIVGGILNIVSGVVFIIAGILILTVEWEEAPLIGLIVASTILFAGSIMPIVGGIFALKRKLWVLAS
jgi:uncharacterized membrane protein HdeD (DUF308 family)